MSTAHPELGHEPSVHQPWYPRIPGHNVDRIDVGAGLAELAKIGYDDDQRTQMVIELSLQLWARGEEAAAQKKAIDTSWYGIDLTSWTRVLAAARAGGEAAASAPDERHTA